MGAEITERQSKQSERATIMLTRSEKQELRLVASFDEQTESDVLRLVLPLVRERAQAIRAGKARAA